MAVPGLYSSYGTEEATMGKAMGIQDGLFAAGLR
jgi:hypothetical protein